MRLFLDARKGSRNLFATAAWVLVLDGVRLAPKGKRRFPSGCVRVVQRVVQLRKSPAIPYAAIGRIGEGGIRTHGTVTRTTVFETAISDAHGRQAENAFMP